MTSMPRTAAFLLVVTASLAGAACQLKRPDTISTRMLEPQLLEPQLPKAAPPRPALPSPSDPVAGNAGAGTHRPSTASSAAIWRADRRSGLAVVVRAGPLSRHRHPSRAGVASGPAAGRLGQRRSARGNTPGLEYRVGRRNAPCGRSRVSVHGNRSRSCTRRWYVAASPSPPNCQETWPRPRVACCGGWPARGCSRWLSSERRRGRSETSAVSITKSGRTRRSRHSKSSNPDQRSFVSS